MFEKPIYEEIRSRSFEKLEFGNLEVDGANSREIDNGHRGYVLQISLQDSFPEYEGFVSQFERIEPSQYFVNRQDLHLTVFEFCSVREDYAKCEKYIESYKDIARSVLNSVGPFPIEFRGTVFTDSSGIIAGYDKDILIDIRESLRNKLEMHGLPNLERYHSKTAHISFMGYRQRFSDYSQFLKLVKETKSLIVGTVQVNRMELVEHDWLNRHQTKKMIEQYQLNKVG